MVFTEEEKGRAKKLLDDYFKAVAEGTPFTAVFTTDGVRRLMFTSGHALPHRYLEPWEDDQKSDVDLSLDFSSMEEKIDEEKVIRVGDAVLKPVPVPRRETE